MIVSWSPVIAVDIIGSLLTLVTACVCARLSWDWKKSQPEDIFRDYIFLLTLAFVFFAVSRSFGHLFKQYLIFSDQNDVWKSIAPFSGAVNSAAFIVIFAFGVYFQRFKKLHLELSEYRDNLEELVAKRTKELEKEISEFLAKKFGETGSGRRCSMNCGSPMQPWKIYSTVRCRCALQPVILI